MEKFIFTVSRQKVCLLSSQMRIQRGVNDVCHVIKSVSPTREFSGFYSVCHLRFCAPSRSIRAHLWSPEIPLGKRIRRTNSSIHILYVSTCICLQELTLIRSVNTSDTQLYLFEIIIPKVSLFSLGNTNEITFLSFLKCSFQTVLTLWTTFIAICEWSTHAYLLKNSLAKGVFALR